MTCCKSHKEPCTRRCTGWSSRDGSARNGARRETGREAKFYHLTRAGTANSKGTGAMGAALERGGAGDPDGVGGCVWRWDVAANAGTLFSASAARRERSWSASCGSMSSRRPRKTSRAEWRRTTRGSAALRRLGGVAQVQEECRDMRRVQYHRALRTGPSIRAAEPRQEPGLHRRDRADTGVEHRGEQRDLQRDPGSAAEPLPYRAADRVVRIFYRSASYREVPDEPLRFPGYPRDNRRASRAWRSTPARTFSFRAPASR